MSELLSFFDLGPHAGLVLARTGRILLILLVAWLLQGLATRLIRTFQRYTAERIRDGDQLSRISTVEQVLRDVAMVVIAIVAGTLVLDELGVSVVPILATAGVAGIAIGFGAQSLIKDYFNGVFLLVEDQIRQGDEVEVSGKEGLVEEMTLRHVRLRDFEGRVYFVPNSEIKVVVNHTREFGWVVVDASVAPGTDLTQAFAAIREAGEALRADLRLKPAILEDLTILGMEHWDRSGMLLRCRIRVRPRDRFDVRREFLLMLKSAFDARGIQP